MSSRAILLPFGIMLAMLLPWFAAAEDIYADRETRVAQLLTVAATLQAQATALTRHTDFACALLASKKEVVVGEVFTLAWGSVGALGPGEDPGISAFPKAGFSHVVLDAPGKWKYSFDFYDGAGSRTTCSVLVTVL